MALTYRTAGLAVLGWELLYRIFQLVLYLVGDKFVKSGKKGDAKEMLAARQEKFRTQGPSYFVACTHAWIMAVRGGWHVVQLLPAPTAAQMSVPKPGDPWYATVAPTGTTSILFFSFLVYDLQQLGGALYGRDSARLRAQQTG